MDSITGRPSQPLWVEAEDKEEVSAGIISQSDSGESGPEELEIPTELAILPIRNGVAFPGTVIISTFRAVAICASAIMPVRSK